jgi:hypothetical protein
VTVLDVLGLMARRWYILVLGLLLTAAVGLSLERTSGVYWARADVLFLADESSAGDNPLQNQTDSVIHFASVVQQSIGESSVQLKLSSPNATLQGSGIREGYVARLSDSGGQWASSFNRAVIEVEVVDSSPEEVRRVLDGVLGRISDATEQVQREAGVDPAAFITVDTADDEASIGYMGSTRGSRIRGLAVVALVGGTLTLVAAAAVDRARLRRVAGRRADGGVTASAGAAPDAV